MFKKILQSLSKSHAAKQPTPLPPPAKSVVAQPVAKTPVVIERVAKAPATPSAEPTAPSPEELCQISPKQPKEQIHAQLKLLYRRYNRSASSLDPKIRSEADVMLDAIVKVREKHFGEI